MQTLSISKAVAGEDRAAAEIYRAIFADYAAGRPNCTNWSEEIYPTLEDAREALAAGTLYIGKWDGETVACANLNHVQLPEYTHVPWTVPAEGKEVLVIHTLCVHPKFGGRGIARSFVAFAEELGRSLGCKALRMDTYEGNLPATALYHSMGYNDLGLTEFLFQGTIRENLRCFDKAL